MNKMWQIIFIMMCMFICYINFIVSIVVLMYGFTYKLINLKMKVLSTLALLFAVSNVETIKIRASHDCLAAVLPAPRF